MALHLVDATHASLHNMHADHNWIKVMARLLLSNSSYIGNLFGDLHLVLKERDFRPTTEACLQFSPVGHIQ